MGEVSFLLSNPFTSLDPCRLYLRLEPSALSIASLPPVSWDKSLAAKSCPARGSFSTPSHFPGCAWEPPPLLYSGL